MKKSVKITLWLLFAIVALGVVLFLSADIIASTLVKKEVSKAFANIPDANAEVGNIYLNLISGSAVVKDISFSTHSLQIEEENSVSHTPGLAIRIPTLAVWNVDYYQLLRHRRLEIFSISPSRYGMWIITSSCAIAVWRSSQSPWTIRRWLFIWTRKILTPSFLPCLRIRPWRKPDCGCNPLESAMWISIVSLRVCIVPPLRL